MTERDDRAARLAEELRANLKRRKAQARAAGAATPGQEPGNQGPGGRHGVPPINE